MVSSLNTGISRPTSLVTAESFIHGAEDASIIANIRRNGKPFSCEPCRRGKLKCDHRTPICGRCIRRNKQDQCVYHPAPLTKPRASLDAGAARRSRTASSSISSGTFPHIEIHPNGLVSPPLSSTPSAPMTKAFGSPMLVKERTSISAPTPSLRRSSTAPYPNLVIKEDQDARMASRDGRLGYLGSTSFAAIFRDSGDSDLAEETQDESKDLPPVAPEKIRQGAEVLSLLKDIPLHRRFTRRWFDTCDGGVVVMEPVYGIWIDEVWREFGPLLTESDPEQLRLLSELVWRNTRQSIRLHGGMSCEDWAKSGTGRHLRWEVVGIILCMSGIIAVNLSDWDSLFDDFRKSYTDKGTFLKRMYRASEFCLCFCYECEVLNDMYISFMMKNLVLVECMKGDAHYAAWQRTGEMCDAVVAMGLHQGNVANMHTPFWMAEYRKKLFICAYGRDKHIATFLGRPPRLSYRYCKMDPPLELSEDQVYLQGPGLEDALSKIDSQGRNTSGDVYRSTWMRMSFQHSRIREDILEISLGSEVTDILDRAQQIRRDLDLLHAAYPESLRVPPEVTFQQGLRDRMSVGGHRDSTPGRPSHHMVSILTIWSQLGVLHTELLLLRALVNRRQADYKQLIPTSRRVLSMVLLALSHREFFRDMQLDLTYLMFSHGVPSAGVLAIELLKQEQSKQYTPEILPRSETIQDISVLIAALSSVGPYDGNYYICDQGRRSLRKVLDRILNPQLLPMGGPTSNSQCTPIGGPNDLLFPTGNDADFLQWLENVEWEKTMWMTPATP